MWYGKIGVIMWIFSIAILFSSGYLNQIFNDPWLNSHVTIQSINSTTSTLQFNQQINTNLVFGDFLSTFTFLGNLMSGGYFSLVFGSGGVITNTGFGALDQWFSVLMALMFDSGTVFLLLYIISFRSI